MTYWKIAIAQYESIRRLSQANMMGAITVQRIAFENDFHELVNLIEEGKYFFIIDHYSELIKLIKDSDIPKSRKIKAKWSLV